MATSTDKKPRKTLYWSIQLDTNTILNHELIKKSLDSNKQLVPLTHMHSTLLYVGRKDDNREKIFEQYKDKLCNVTVTCHGVSNDALALKVSKLEFADTYLTDKVPTFATIQHVTVALNKDVKAVDSIKSFSEGNVVDYDDEFVLNGKIRQCFY